MAAGVLLLCGCDGRYREAASKVTHDQSGLWVLSPMDSIAPYRDLAPCDTIELHMAGGEAEHFQVVVSGGGKFNVCRVERRSSGVEMTVRQVARWNGADDVLALAADSVGADGDGPLKLWVTYTTPQNARPGTHDEIIELTRAGLSRYVQVRLHVYDCSVPEVPTIPAVFGIDPSRLGLSGNETPEERSAEKKRWSDLLLDHRISPYFSTWIDGTMKVENSSSPWEWDDPRTVDYLSDPRFVRFAAPCYSLDDNALQTFIDTLRRRELLQKAYYYVWDEPKNMAEYACVIDEAERIHRAAPEARIITTFFCGPGDGDRKDDLFAVWDILRGHTSIFCTGVWSLRMSEQRADSCRTALRDGEEWWSYVCMGDSPGLSIQNNNRIRNRATMWRSFKEQSTGFLYWVVNSYGIDGSGAITPRADLPYGDGVLVYPGGEFSPDDTLSVSARLECWKDGAEDYELLKMIETKYGREAALKLLSTVYLDPAKQCSSAAQVAAFKKAMLETLGQCN
jgi:hypothetical protein